MHRSYHVDPIVLACAVVGTVIVLFLMALGDPAAPSVNEARCPKSDACQVSP